MRRRAASEFTIKDGEVVPKKPKSGPRNGAFFASLDPEGDDGEFFVSSAEMEEVPVPSETNEYTRFVADLTRATLSDNKDKMKQLVLHRFEGLLAMSVLRDAIERRRETMAFVSHALNNVLRLYMIPMYIRDLRGASYTNKAPLEDDLMKLLCKPIESRYEDEYHVRESVYGLVNDLLNINLYNFERRDENMRMMQRQHDTGVEKLRAAKDPWITVRGVDSYEYLTRLGTVSWDAPASDKLALACETARGVGIYKDTPANLRDAGEIAAQWRGNLGMEFVFPHGNAARCAEYNEIIFGCPAKTTFKDEKTRRKACAISAALRLFIKLADDHFKSIGGIDTAYDFGELGIPITIAEYATLPFPFPLEHPLNGGSYEHMRAFIVNMIKQSDAVCRIGRRDELDP